MAKPILSKTQEAFLSLFSKNQKLASRFYLTGGTALSAWYIPYRYSEDLDFFSEQEFEIQEIIVFLKSRKDAVGYSTIDIQTSINRNIVQLLFRQDILKLEFTFFPFPNLETPSIQRGVRVDSLKDIAVNKLFTLYQKPRSRDYFDLFMIQRKFELPLTFLVKNAKVKFDWHVDPLQLGSRFLEVRELKDYPKLITKINPHDVEDYFVGEAKNLRDDIFEK